MWTRQDLIILLKHYCTPQKNYLTKAESSAAHVTISQVTAFNKGILLKCQAPSPGPTSLPASDADMPALEKTQE